MDSGSPDCKAWICYLRRHHSHSSPDLVRSPVEVLEHPEIVLFSARLFKDLFGVYDDGV